jgi:hypothetical protein
LSPKGGDAPFAPTAPESEASQSDSESEDSDSDDEEGEEEKDVDDAVSYIILFVPSRRSFMSLFFS